MARPSKNQIRKAKEDKARVRREAAIDTFIAKIEQIEREGIEDIFLVACEGCGQEQLSDNPCCVVCGGTTATYRDTITM